MVKHFFICEISSVQDKWLPRKFVKACLPLHKSGDLLPSGGCSWPETLFILCLSHLAEDVCDDSAVTIFDEFALVAWGWIFQTMGLSGCLKGPRVGLSQAYGSACVVVWGPECWSLSDCGRMGSETCYYCCLPLGSQVVKEEDLEFHPPLIVGGDQHWPLASINCWWPK